jgi:hypothetical protein
MSKMHCVAGLVVLGKLHSIDGSVFQYETAAAGGAKLQTLMATNDTMQLHIENCSKAGDLCSTVPGKLLKSCLISAKSSSKATEQLPRNAPKSARRLSASVHIKDKV